MTFTVIRSKQPKHLPKYWRRYWKISTPGIQEFGDQNYAEALPLLTVSAEGGNPQAQCLLGNLYQLGLGDTPPNAAAAMRWYYRSANQGYSIATQNLAVMVWPISQEAAAVLYQLASQQRLKESRSPLTQKPSTGLIAPAELRTSSKIELTA